MLVIPRSELQHTKMVLLNESLFHFFVAYIHVSVLTWYKTINYKHYLYKVCKKVVKSNSEYPKNNCNVTNLNITTGFFSFGKILLNLKNTVVAVKVLRTHYSQNQVLSFINHVFKRIMEHLRWITCNSIIHNATFNLIL